MANDDKIEMEAEVTAVNRDRFTVLTDNGHTAVCTIAGKLRKNMIRVTPGDRVKVAISAYDLTKGIITYRM